MDPREAYLAKNYLAKEETAHETLLTRCGCGCTRILAKRLRHEQADSAAGESAIDGNHAFNWNDAFDRNHALNWNRTFDGNTVHDGSVGQL